MLKKTFKGTVAPRVAWKSGTAAPWNFRCDAILVPCGNATAGCQAQWKLLEELQKSTSEKKWLRDLREYVSISEET